MLQSNLLYLTFKSLYNNYLVRLSVQSKINIEYNYLLQKLLQFSNSDNSKSKKYTEYIKIKMAIFRKHLQSSANTEF